MHHHKRHINTPSGTRNVPALITAHVHPTPREITDHQYLNNLANSIIHVQIVESLEYSHIIKCDKHKNTWGKSFTNELGRLAQREGDIVKDSDAIF